MARPEVLDPTEAVYASLPEVYRDADAAEPSGGGYPLLRYLSLVLDQLDPVTALRRRFTYTPFDERAITAGEDGLAVRATWRRYGSGTYGSGTYGELDTADLVDPTRADAGWLPWLGQLLGVRTAGLTVDEQRAALIRPSAAWARGTSGTIAAELRPYLSGGQYVDTRANYEGAAFTIGVVTKTAESPADIAARVAALVERPAGFALVHAYFEDVDA